MEMPKFYIYVEDKTGNRKHGLVEVGSKEPTETVGETGNAIGRAAEMSALTPAEYGNALYLYQGFLDNVPGYRDCISIPEYSIFTAEEIESVLEELYTDYSRPVAYVAFGHLYERKAVIPHGGNYWKLIK